MPMYTVITQDGTVANGTGKQKSPREITRIHSSVMKVPRSFVRVVFLSYQKGAGFYGWSRSSDGCAELCLAERPQRRSKDRHAEALVGDVPGLDRFRHRSNRDIPSGDSLNQRDGNGADHASGGREHQCLNSSRKTQHASVVRMCHPARMLWTKRLRGELQKSSRKT